MTIEEIVSALGSSNVVYPLLYSSVYFIILIAPFLLYIKHYSAGLGSDEGDKGTFAEKIVLATLGQVAILVIFAGITWGIEKSTIGTAKNMKPSVALNIFFGEGDKPIWIHWNDTMLRIQQSGLGNTNSTGLISTITGSYFDRVKDINAVAVGINVITIAFLFMCTVTPFLIITLPFLLMIRKDGEKGGNSDLGSSPFVTLFNFFIGMLIFFLIILGHSEIAKLYPAIFLNGSTLSYDFIESIRWIYSKILST